MNYKKYYSAEYFANHIVIVERIKNDINGNPRYHATVIPKESAQDWHSAPRYTIKMYGSERQIAERAIELYEQDIANGLHC